MRQRQLTLLGFWIRRASVCKDVGRWVLVGATLNSEKTLHHKLLNPKTLNPKALNPKTLNPKP